MWRRTEIAQKVVSLKAAIVGSAGPFSAFV
jgi:hypothetical protein